jgi:glutamate/tyrosine decarboxylase-like PLP-dependent enzyme
MNQDELQAVLTRIAAYTVAHRAGVGERKHRPELSALEVRARFDAPTPEHGASLDEVISDLIERAEPGLSGMIGPRFFGWVIGASEPAGMAADWLTSAWGQNAGNYQAAPSTGAAEEISARWLLDLMDLPRESSVGFCTGATMASFIGLAAARSEVLRRVGWDVDADGLFGAPPIQVVLGEDAHSTIFSALKYLGLGHARVTRIAVDGNGAMRADAFAAAMRGAKGPCIVIVQAGHLHSGGFDPFTEIAPIAREAGAWLHVDGAFGLWARAAPDRAHLAAGVEQADSWSVDGHKWLQTPYDCGYAIVRDSAAHVRAMQIAASYLPAGDFRHPYDYTPELSRRARGFATWAMIRSLGRSGIADMVSRHCALARRFAEKLGAESDVAIMNDVVLNQVAVRLGADLDDDRADHLTERALARVQQEGECFVAGALWQGKQILRISVISAGTTEADIDRSAAAIIAAWRAERSANA